MYSFTSFIAFWLFFIVYQIPVFTFKKSKILIDFFHNDSFIFFAITRKRGYFLIRPSTSFSIVHASEVVKVGEFPVAASKRKNTSIAKEAYKMLKGTHLNFVGNIEGKDIFNGDVDVVVCDGFTGNVSMKIVEGLAEALFSLLEKGEKATLIETIKRKFDYSEYGGAPLLGINGACIISHGRSSKNAIKNAIHLASEFVSLEVNHSIQEEIQRYGPFYRLRRGLAKD
ncbi:TPA: hypothetical protein EYP66_02900 [Candidatus Poribacteria bacterium]|nr:hypothetical protein [Candidatus Poribacteria bacterium]